MNNLDLAGRFFGSIRKSMREADLPCDLAEKSHDSSSRSLSISFANRHVAVSFVYETYEPAFICGIDLWRRDVDPPDRYRGTQFVVGSFPVSYLDPSPPSFDFTDEFDRAVNYHVALLRGPGTNILCGNFGAAESILERVRREQEAWTLSHSPNT